MSKVNEAKAIPTRFTPEVAAAITGLMKATEALDLKRESVIDALRAAGIKSTDFISPKSEGSTATPELNAAFKAAIVKGFPAAKRKLLNAPKGSLSKEQMKLGGMLNSLLAGTWAHSSAIYWRGSRRE